ncbi:MAG: protein kinase domain-containing protein [Gammaproteobacteria bacterium]
MLNEVVGNYKILDKIGEGGMGEVFKAIDVMLEREVAIKVLRPELADKSEIVARFRKEAVVLAKLNHPNIATLYNFVHHGDRYFMVMEFAHGRTLDVIINRHPNGLPWRRSLELFLDALHAIEHAHNLDIVHRDVKPSNMMVNDRDILKVLDFGIARVLGSAHLTRVGLLVGTLKYMSPEQIRGRDTDARSDIYSLGIVLYKMLSGRMPFAAEGEFELMRAQIEERPLPLRVILPEVPRAVDDAVLQALAKSPDDRFQTAREFIDALGQVLREDADGFVAGAPPWRVRTKSVRSESASVRPRLGISGNLVRAPTEISGPTGHGRRGTDDASAPTEIDITPASLPAWKPPPPLGRRLVEAPVEPPPARPSPDDAPRRQAQQPMKPGGGTPDPIIRSLLAVERELSAQSPGRRSARITPQRTDPPPTTPPSPGETPTEHCAVGRDSPRTAGMSRAGMARWVFAILLAAGLTIAILNGAFSPLLDSLRIAWLMQRGEAALAAGKVSGPEDDTAATYAEEALQLAPKQVEARKLMTDVIARLVEAGESSVKQRELPEAKLHSVEARRLAVKYAVGEEEVATLEKRIVAEEARRAAIVRQREAEEQRRKRIAAHIEQGRGAFNAGRLREAVAQAQEVLGVAPESAEARQVLNDAAEGMVKDAEDALTRGDLPAAKAQAQDARALVQQHSLPQAKLADVSAKIAQEEQKRDELQRQRQEQERQAEQKRAEEATLGARINGLSSVTEQERAIEKPPEPENMRREQAPSPTPVPKPAPGPAAARDQPAGVSAEPAGQAAAVEILAATPTQTLARPGNTIEFYTRFQLVPPPGRGGAYVEATWALKRAGRSLGQPGGASVFAKAGIGTLSTALTLPAGMAPGRYTVEHRIETENGEDSARSHFSVVSR